MPRLIVRGVNLLDENLPGCVLIPDESLFEAACLDAFRRAWLIRDVPLSAWRRDVQLHASELSDPCTCSRIPVTLLLPTDLSLNHFYEIEAKLFDPDVYCGREMGMICMSKVLGLPSPCYGLELRAHNQAGLLAALEWIQADYGDSSILAQLDFSSYECPALDPAQTQREVKESEPETSFEGHLFRVRIGSEIEVWRCIKHVGDRVRLSEIQSVTALPVEDDVKELKQGEQILIPTRHKKKGVHLRTLWRQLDSVTIVED